MEGNRMISTATRWWVTGDPNAPMLRSVLQMYRAAQLVLRERLQAKFSFWSCLCNTRRSLSAWRSLKKLF